MNHDLILFGVSQSSLDGIHTSTIIQTTSPVFGPYGYGKVVRN